MLTNTHSTRHEFPIELILLILSEIPQAQLSTVFQRVPELRNLYNYEYTTISFISEISGPAACLPDAIHIKRRSNSIFTVRVPSYDLTDIETLKSLKGYQRFLAQLQEISSLTQDPHFTVSKQLTIELAIDQYSKSLYEVMNFYGFIHRYFQNRPHKVEIIKRGKSYEDVLFTKSKDHLTHIFINDYTGWDYDELTHSVKLNSRCPILSVVSFGGTEVNVRASEFFEDLQVVSKLEKFELLSVENSYLAEVSLVFFTDHERSTGAGGMEFYTGNLNTFGKETYIELMFKGLQRCFRSVRQLYGTGTLLQLLEDRSRHITDITASSDQYVKELSLTKGSPLDSLGLMVHKDLSSLSELVYLNLMKGFCLQFDTQLDTFVPDATVLSHGQIERIKDLQRQTETLLGVDFHLILTSLSVLNEQCILPRFCEFTLINDERNISTAQLDQRLNQIPFHMARGYIMEGLSLAEDGPDDIRARNGIRAMRAIADGGRVVIQLENEDVQEEDMAHGINVEHLVDNYDEVGLDIIY
ncbi:hypothetical protein WICPIJ_003761 [Wickerhamomyces pijperi]|uniref:Uncharacterized protein n=1 Tax=Wickerhamomyces pijperi TaxID=599730 RepID=A0A9P8Q931_WICPI|nr:hypothetical protein WICPIJ_003761 [Wickerhamomyces pijperi]